MIPFKIPNGYPEIVATYRDPRGYSSPRAQVVWQYRILVPVSLPAPLPYIGKSTGEVLVHRKAAPFFQAAFRALGEDVNLIRELNGTYSFRGRLANQSEFSIRVFGAAIDLDQSQGGPDERVIAAFTEAGFTWGGSFVDAPKEPSLFQLATGYEG